MNKHYTWRTYSFLTTTLLVSTLMLLIDPILVAISVEASDIVIYTVFIGVLLSIALGITTFINKDEKRPLAIIALIITLLNIAVIAFFLWFGANFS